MAAHAEAIRGPTNRRRRVYVFTGLLHCAAAAAQSADGTVDIQSAAHRGSTSPTRATASVSGAGCTHEFFPEAELEAAVLRLLRAMAIPDGLAEAVEAAISSYASQQRKTSRRGTRRSAFFFS